VGAGGTSVSPDLGIGGSNAEAGSNRDAGPLDLADASRDNPSDKSLDKSLDTPSEGKPDARNDGGNDGRLTDVRDARDAGESGKMLRLVAGGLGGPGDKDGIGAAARFSSPASVTTDGTGSLFVADEESHTIRRIDIATGAVTTLAGSPGNSGSTDGTGTAARFSSPRSLASDGSGHLVVSDSGNNTIRCIDTTTGAVTTLAGSPGDSDSTDGTGAAARFNYPAGLAFDGLGNLFVADSRDHTIRKVEFATGAVTTFAGSAGNSGSTDGIGAAARFNYPVGLAFGGLGNLFVADAGNHTIRRIDIATGTVSTFAGSPGIRDSTDGVGSAARFNSPADLASDGAGNLFVVDNADNAIRSVVIATGAVATLAALPGTRGSTDGAGIAVRFDDPTGVASDGTGNLFVADLGNHKIRKVVIATGVVSAFAGSQAETGSLDGTGSAARFYHPSGVACDSEGNLFVADFDNDTIRRIVIATGAVTTLAGFPGIQGSTDGVGAAARFFAPLAVTSDGAGNLFVCDRGNQTVRKVDIATGEVATLAGTPFYGGPIDGMGSAARFVFPGGIAGDGSGNLFVADSGDHTIRKVEIATGTVTTFAGSESSLGSTDGTGTDARFYSPMGMASDGLGNLFIADTDNDTIRKLVIATGVVTTFAGSARSSGSTDGKGTDARFNSPRAITSDMTGNLFVADTLNHAIRKIVIATQAVTTVVGSPDRIGVILGPLPAGLDCPAGLALGPSGELLIADGCENSILAAWF
jgi:hypothetical protein